MNFLDLVVLIVFLGVFALGFFVGIARTVAMLISLVVGLLCASLGYDPLGRELMKFLNPISVDMAQLIAFVALLATATVMAFYLVARSFATRRLRTRMPLEGRGGLAGNLALVVLAAILAGGVVIVLVQASERTVVDLQPSGPVVQIDRQYRDSFLAAQVRRVTPSLYGGVSDVLHQPAPQILVPVGR